MVQVPWTADYNDTMFSITLKKSGPLVLVLSQVSPKSPNTKTSLMEVASLTIDISKGSKASTSSRYISDFIKMENLDTLYAATATT